MMMLSSSRRLGSCALWHNYRGSNLIDSLSTRRRFSTRPNDNKNPPPSLQKSQSDSSFKRSSSKIFGNGGSTKPTEQAVHSLPPRITFEDFLQADTNRDGRVTAAEWDSYVKSKSNTFDSAMRKGVTVHFPVPPTILREIIESHGFAITVNGLHYSLTLKPEGTTRDLIRNAEAQLERLERSITEMEATKAPLDAKAARHVRRVMSGLLGYLLLQAGVVAKLTFYSRFGWDIMEPITYFLTFGISLVGLIFFTWNRLEFSYPALAALVARRKAIKLYKKYNFDEESYLTLKHDRARVREYLESLMPAHRIFELESPVGIQPSVPPPSIPTFTQNDPKIAK